ncbi:ABC transporter substrate-binding protein [Chloroflexota bacterium]
MRRLKYLGFILLAVLVALALLAGCAGKQVPTTPIKIGHIGEFTGFAAIYGPPQKEAMEYALDEIGWEIEGRKIELISEDGGSDPATGADKARKLAERDNVDVIIGPLLSSSGAAVAAYLQGPGTPNIGLANHGTELCGKMRDGIYTNIFLTDGIMPSMGYPLGKYAYEKLGYRTASLVEADYVAGWDFNGGFQRGFEESGGRVLQIQRAPLGTMDFSPYITALKKVDCVSYFLPGMGLAFHKQYYDASVGIPLLEPQHDSLIAPELNQLGDDVVGMVASGVWSPLIDIPQNKAFVDGWKQKFGKVPETHNETGYTAVQVFLEAVRYTKGDTSHEAILDALRNITVDTPRGTVSYTSDGLGVIPVYILQVVKVDYGNEWQPLASYPMKHIWEYPSEPTK